jgi:hypothetical protein
MYSTSEPPFPYPIHPLFSVHHGANDEAQPSQHLGRLVLWSPRHRFVSLLHP